MFLLSSVVTMFLIHAYRVFRIMSVTIIKHFAQENIEILFKSRGRSFVQLTELLQSFLKLLHTLR